MRLEWPGGSRDIGERPVLIGRDPVACDVAIEHDSLLSRLHFAIVPSTGGAYLLDLRSSNGTYVNGARVHYSRLRGGDQGTRAGTGRFDFKDGRAHNAALKLVPEPSVSFLASRNADPLLGYLRALGRATEWQEALDAAASGLVASAAESGLQEPAAFALGMERGEPVAISARGGEGASFASVLGPTLTRLRHLERPFLVDTIDRDSSFLPRGYPIQVEHVASLVAAPLGSGGDSGILCLTSRDPLEPLGAEHLRLVEVFALPLSLAADRLLQERAQA